MTRTEMFDFYCNDIISEDTVKKEVEKRFPGYVLRDYNSRRLHIPIPRGYSFCYEVRVEIEQPGFSWEERVNDIFIFQGR
ncbi:MAG: hypothetical protein IJN50_03765 [Clostridia bacterium]|nr:hypothetical protein [Clostridia bacterium]